MRRSDETSWLNGLTNAPAKKDRSKKCSGGVALDSQPAVTAVTLIAVQPKDSGAKPVIRRKTCASRPEISDYLNWLKNLAREFLYLKLLGSGAHRFNPVAPIILPVTWYTG